MSRTITAAEYPCAAACPSSWFSQSWVTGSTSAVKWIAMTRGRAGVPPAAAPAGRARTRKNTARSRRFTGTASVRRAVRQTPPRRRSRARDARARRRAARAGRARRSPRRATPPADVDPDPEHDALARLGEDPRHLAAVDQHVVRVLDRRLRADRRRDGVRRDESQLGPARDRLRRIQRDREHEARVDPRPAQATAARGLALGERDGAVRRRPPAASAASSRSPPRSGIRARTTRGARAGRRRGSGPSALE